MLKKFAILRQHMNKKKFFKYLTHDQDREIKCKPLRVIAHIYEKGAERVG